MIVFKNVKMAGINLLIYYIVYNVLHIVHFVIMKQTVFNAKVAIVYIISYVS